jgi:pilus assembly protein Flp/PilA
MRLPAFYLVKLTDFELLMYILRNCFGCSRKHQHYPIWGARSITMKSLFSRFIKDESGATAIEYGLIPAIIGVGIIAALGTVKDELNTKFNTIGSALNSAK